MRTAQKATSSAVETPTTTAMAMINFTVEREAGLAARRGERTDRRWMDGRKDGIDGWKDEWMEGCKGGWMDGWMDENGQAVDRRKEGRMDGWNRWMEGWMVGGMQGRMNGWMRTDRRWMEGWMDRWNRWMEGRMDVWKDEWMNGRTDGRMDGCRAGFDAKAFVFAASILTYYS